MHACFPNMRNIGYDASVTHLRAIWNGRKIASHARDWMVISHPRPAIFNRAGVKVRAANSMLYKSAEYVEFLRFRGIVHDYVAKLGYSETSR